MPKLRDYTGDMRSNSQIPQVPVLVVDCVTPGDLRQFKEPTTSPKIDR